MFEVQKKYRKLKSKVARTKNGRIMLLLKCVVCDGEKSKFTKQQKTSWLLSSLEIKIPINKIPLLGSLLF